MELDDLKSAWQALDRNLGRQHILNLELFRDTRVDKLRRGLRLLVWGQIIQILIGAAGSLVFAPFWIAHLHQPGLLVAGLIMHLYCIGLIVFGAIILNRIASIDYAEPVVAIQHRLLRLRRTYSVHGAVFLGLPWWFLYVPLVIVLARISSGVNLNHTAPAFVYVGLSVGIVGLAASVIFYRWSHRPGRERLGRAVDDGMTGSSIRRAQTALEELALFEEE